MIIYLVETDSHTFIQCNNIRSSCVDGEEELFLTL